MKRQMFIQFKANFKRDQLKYDNSKDLVDILYPAEVEPSQQ